MHRIIYYLDVIEIYGFSFASLLRNGQNTHRHRHTFGFVPQLFLCYNHRLLCDRWSWENGRRTTTLMVIFGWRRHANDRFQTKIFNYELSHYFLLLHFFVFCFFFRVFVFGWKECRLSELQKVACKTWTSLMHACTSTNAVRAVICNLGKDFVAIDTIKWNSVICSCDFYVFFLFLMVRVLYTLCTSILMRLCILREEKYIMRLNCRVDEVSDGSDGGGGGFGGDDHYDHGKCLWRSIELCSPKLITYFALRFCTAGHNV